MYIMFNCIAIRIKFEYKKKQDDAFDYLEDY